MAVTKDAALRKRQQIAKANRTMFFWVAGVSVIVGFAAVTSVFLARQMAFNNKVIGVKSNTVSTIKNNMTAVDELKDNIRALNSNQTLINLKAQPDDQALQVILDALPADANATALGSSLQNKILAEVPGLTLQTLNVSSVSAESIVVDQSAIDSPVANAITFQMDVSGSAESLKELVLRMERSIRTIDITELSLEQQGGVLTLSVEGRAFYEPARVLELKDEEVRP